MNKISLSDARKLILQSQLLYRPEKFDGKQGTLKIIERLGYLQIDTLAVIKRSHHHTLWTRQPGYSEAYLHDLQSVDRAVFEYWSHAMSYIPMSDYRYFLPRMKNFRNPSHRWIQKRLEECGSLLQPILDRIREEGPLSSKDITHKRQRKAGSWWDWKPAKFALEILFWRGDLMVAERHGFQKYYDLTERVLPADVDTTCPQTAELARFIVRRGLAAMGLATLNELQKFMQPDAARDSDWRAVDNDQIEQALRDFMDRGEIAAIRIEGKSDDEYYVLNDKYSNTGSLAANDCKALFLLSPFDNLIIQRDRLRSLFAFEYTLESYLPAHKRKYGYFSLPVLWGEHFAGRLDPCADRKKRVLHIKEMHFEKNFNSSDDFLAKLAQKLHMLAGFNDCDRIEFDRGVAGKTGEALHLFIRDIQTGRS